jgi:hypothetical protein
MSEEQISHGPTTWRCECGRAETTEAFVLPKGWVEMDLALGSGDILHKKHKKLLCADCGSRFLLGGVRAMTALPAPRAALPSTTTQRISTISLAKSSGKSRFRK